MKQNNQRPRGNRNRSQGGPLRNDSLQNSRTQNVRYQGTRHRGDHSRRDGLVSRILIVFGVLLLVVALSIGGFLIFQYVDAQNRYRDITSLAGLEGLTDASANKELKLEDIHIDWAALRAENTDIVAWVIIPGTRVNYPVVQGGDNTYYLKHLFDGTYNDSGTVFADYQGARTLDAQNNIIYGHNMLDGSMFADVNQYSSSEYLMEHQTVFLATPERNYELKAVATIKPTGYDKRFRDFSFDTTEEFASYRDYLFSLAIATADNLEQETADVESFYSFATCETNNDTYRIILTAVPVRSIEAP